MRSISKDQVNHIAKLAQIPLKEGEDSMFAEIFSDTIEYINVLNELDTSNTLETYQVTGLVNVYQKGNENMATLSQEDALKNAAIVEKKLIGTKGVFENRE
jgi:aspartyl/glutamyl-tRNA(Asn/Gln) amidotransferase C subunit